MYFSNQRLRSYLMLSAPVWCTLLAHNAEAACTSSTNLLTLNCSGTLTTAITAYDPAAAFQPTAGSNAYTPANPAFPAASNPNNPGYNPNPPTTTINFDATTVFNVTTNTTTSLADRGLLAANFSNSENPAVNNVVVNNAGVLSLTTAQIAQGGRMDVLVGDSQVNTFTVNNSGTVSITQNFFAPFNIANLSVTASGSPATYTAKYSGATLADVADFYSDDNTNEYVVNNAAGASAVATGNYATVVYGRADTTINNSGLMANTSWTAADAIGTGHWVIANWAGTDYVTAPNTNPDSNIVLLNSDGSVAVQDTSATTLTNTATGVIKGDILAVDTTPLAYAANGANPAAVSGGNAGPRDSNVENQGLINGNFYLGSGTHVIDNAAGGIIGGNINVDQRASQASYATPTAGSAIGTYLSAGGTDFSGNTCVTAGQNTTDAGCAVTHNVLASFFGGRSFTLTNEGTLIGNITINDQPGAVNSVTLTGNGFTGSISALNGTGSNSLILDGVTGSGIAKVQNFTDLNLTTSNVMVTAGVTLVPDQNVPTPQATLETTIFGAGGTRTAPSTNLGSLNGSLTLTGPTVITPTFGGIARNGDVYEVASSVTGGGIANITVNNTSALVTMTASTSSGALEMSTSINDPATSGASRAGAATLANLISYGGDSATVQILGGAVESLASLDEVRNAGERLRPEVNGSTIQVPIDVTGALHSQIGDRLDSLLFGATATQTEPDSGFWLNGLGAQTRQQNVSGIAGFNANTAGLITGYDKLLDHGLRLGASLAIATSTIDNAVLTGDRQSLQTFQGLGYGQFAQPQWYVNFSAGAGSINFDTQRSIDFPGFADTAAASYKGMIYSSHAEAGYPLTTTVGVIAPVASLTYIHVQQNAYSETSTSGAALSVAQQSTNSVRPGLGVKATFPFSLSPTFTTAVEARAIYEHEFGNTTQNVTAGFEGSDASFAAVGPAASRDMVDLGVALRMSVPRFGQTIAISYSALVRQHYVQQLGMLRVRIDF